MVFSADMLLSENYEIPTKMEITNVEESYFDTALNKPVWFNGYNWVDATGNKV